MQQHDTQYPPFPMPFVQHTQSYKWHGLMNDPSLPEFLAARLFPSFFKKRFFVGYTILNLEIVKVEALVMKTGAFIAMCADDSKGELSTADMKTDLMSICEPRPELTKSPINPEFGLWQYWSAETELQLDAYASKYGHRPVSIRELLDGFGLHFIDLGNPNSLKKKITWLQFEEALLDIVMMGSIVKFNTGIVTAINYPEMCEDVAGLSQSSPVLLELCREWASTWRPQLTRLFVG